MPINGNAAIALVEPAPVVAPSNGAPVAAPAVTEAEAKIGKAAAAAVIAIAMGIDDYATVGSITPSSRTWAGGMLGRLAELNLAHFGEDDFGTIARRAGRRAIQDHPCAVFLTQLGPPDRIDALIDELLDHALAIAAKVTASELALRAN